MNNTTELKSLSQIRDLRAKAILEKGNPEVLDDNNYLVPSQFSDKKYLVTFFDTYSCNCPDFQHRCKGKGLYCKHIKTILLFQKLKEKAETISQNIELFIETPKQALCPYCNSEDLIKSGIRKTQIENKQRYECKKCKKRFVLTPIPKIKGTPKIVCLAMDCYYRGLSYRDISHQFQQFYGLNISHETIRNWILRFSEMIERYTRTLTPKTSGTWNADETMVLTKRGKEKNNPNGNFDYVWNVMDNKTKFLLASLNSGRTRTKKDAKKVMLEAYNQNKKLPNQIITDRYRGYQDGIKKAFNNFGYRRKIKHTSILGRRKQINNNAIESHHTQQKEFHKIRRGVTKVQDYADGFKVFHNFVRKNVKDKKTPAEKCGIYLNNLNKWENLLLNSIKNV